MGVNVWGIFSCWISLPYFKCFQISEAFHIAYSRMLLYVSLWHHQLKCLEFFLTYQPLQLHTLINAVRVFPILCPKIQLKFSPKQLKGSHCLLSPFFSGRKPQIALIVFIVLLHWKTVLLLLLFCFYLSFYYNLFSTFIAGLLVIRFPKWCLFNLVIISQIRILHSLLLPFISFSLFIIYLRLFDESYFPENWKSFPDSNSPYISLMFF